MAKHENITSEGSFSAASSAAFGVRSRLQIRTAEQKYEVGYYFSAENLARDRFLRRQMNAEGWVPLPNNRDIVKFDLV